MLVLAGTRFDLAKSIRTLAAYHAEAKTHWED
jgi:hypothetical protein